MLARLLPAQHDSEFNKLTGEGLRLTEAGSFDTAETLLLAAIDRATKVYGKEFYYAQAHWHLGSMYEKHGVMPKAFKAYSEAYAVWLGSLGAAHTKTMEANQKRAQVWDTHFAQMSGNIVEMAEGGDTGAAERFLTDSLLWGIGLEGKGPVLAEAAFLIGGHYEKGGQYKKAYFAYNKAWHALKKDLGEDDPKSGAAKEKWQQMWGASYPGKEKLELSGLPFTGFHFGRRAISFPQGTMGVLLRDNDGNSFLFESPFSSVPFGLTVDGNLFGVHDSDMWWPWKSMFWANTYLYWSVRAGYSYVPKSEQGTGLSHIFELGADFGAMHVFSKSFFIEAGVKTVPLAMTYTLLADVQVQPTVFSQGIVSGEVQLFMNKFFVGASPYLRTGVFLKRNEGTFWRLDFSACQQLHFIYSRALRAVPLIDGAAVSDDYFNVPDDDVYFNGRPINKKDFHLRGLQFNIGLTFVFR